MKIRKSMSDIVFQIILVLIMILFCLTTLYPFLYLLSLSLTAASVSTTTIHLIPPKWDIGNYVQVLQSENMIRGFVNTIERVVLGTAVQLVAIVSCAYALSKSYFPNRGFWTGAIVFTMFFSGGLIPSYFLIKNLNLFNSIWVYILPGLIPTFTMLIVRNFFMAIPPGLEESARIDGANDIVILFRIVLPVSMPIIATVVLWQMVAHWNAWFDCMLYVSDPQKQVLQMVLRRALLEGTQDVTNVTSTELIEQVKPESLKAAITMVATIPIICVYPFLQKYFVKGVMVGSLKG